MMRKKMTRNPHQSPHQSQHQSQLQSPHQNQHQSQLQSPHQNQHQSQLPSQMKKNKTMTMSKITMNVNVAKTIMMRKIGTITMKKSETSKVWTKKAPTSDYYAS